jgi:hypothetical protein
LAELIEPENETAVKSFRDMVPSMVMVHSAVVLMLFLSVLILNDILIEMPPIIQLDRHLFLSLGSATIFGCRHGRGILDLC